MLYRKRIITNTFVQDRLFLFVINHHYTHRRKPTETNNCRILSCGFPTMHFTILSINTKFYLSIYIYDMWPVCTQEQALANDLDFYTKEPWILVCICTIFMYHFSQIVWMCFLSINLKFWLFFIIFFSNSIYLFCTAIRNNEKTWKTWPHALRKCDVWKL